ncbi:MAG: aminotransferase class V-fold PLP-dependent enzyme [Acidobacteriia bacterium]|nr:aminotransferase class V-fold PLP-dependent enzyme [Terriglobia bacterium]
MLNARQHFPGLLGKIFLDAACISLAPRPAVEAIQKFLDLSMVCPHESATAQHIVMDEMRAVARPAAARLINAHEDEIALVESTTHGLSLAADAIRLEPGDRVLLCDLEFMEVAVPWVQKKREGVEIDVVPNRNGKIQIEDIVAHLTPRTKVVAVSSVQWTNGYRLDLAALSRLCRDRQVWLLVDAIQQLGAVPLDVQQTPVDILACGGHKWLNAPFGCGFLYVRRDLLAQLRPSLTGYLSIQDPPGGWGEYFQTPTITPVQDYPFVSTARRYETGGTANYPGAVGLAASLNLIHSLGQQPIAEHVHALTEQLIAGLDQLPVTVVTPRARKNRSGIVTFSAGSAEENVKLMNRLLEKKILVSVRYTSNIGGVRVSCHFYNSAEDIETLLAELKRLLS